ncbi:7458_t:CDS:2 [Ambispora gerdemannii]|uniref:7458_t:CDS:1 n=1 Tax=Ambispora gerdemannii TaxID=144530 RepID=A0A9N8VFH3_9GLOM|nr:7458_t:CDS:2 [Ambispora gerdemannii]
MKTSNENKTNRKAWTNQEDDQLRQLFSMHKRKWRVIACAMKSGRTDKQVRDRWVHHLDRNINLSPLSPIEKKIIVEKCRTIGHKWAEIAKCLPVSGRTPLMIRNYWHSQNRQAFHRIRERMSVSILLN